MSKLQDVIQKANRDPQFGEQLKANPIAAIKAAGGEIPAGATVEVIEQRSNELHLFLDRRTNDANTNKMLDSANRDAAFKQQLLADPKKCVEAAIGQPLPTGTQVYIHERVPNHIRLLLAPNQDELSEAELEAVAGGGFFKDVWTNLTCRNVNVTVGVNKADYVNGVFSGTGGGEFGVGVDPTNGNVRWDYYHE